MRGWAALLVLLVTLPWVLGVAGLPRHDAPDAPIHTHVGARYLEQGVAETGMKNLVSAVLLNYRGFDTFIEVVVIFTALAAVLSLPRGATTPSRAAPAQVPVSPVVLFAVRLLALTFGGEGLTRLEGRAWVPWLQAAGPLAFALIAFSGWQLTGAFLGWPSSHLLQEVFGYLLEVGIGVGGAVILARLFLSMER